MADIDKRRTSSATLTPLDIKPILITRSVSVTGADVSGTSDFVQLELIPTGYRVVSLIAGHDATLGASCTATFGVSSTSATFVALTGASTAGAASYVAQSVPDVGTNTYDRYLWADIGGADQTATANYNYTFLLTPGPAPVT